MYSAEENWPGWTSECQIRWRRSHCQVLSPEGNYLVIILVSRDVFILGRYCGVSVWWPGPWRWWTTRPLVWSTCWGGRCRNFSNFSCNGRAAWNRSPSSTNRKSYFHWKSYIVQDFSNYVWLGIGISVLILKLTWCRSRRRSSLSPRQGRGLGPGEAGPAPGWPDRA